MGVIFDSFGMFRLRSAWQVLIIVGLLKINNLRSSEFDQFDDDLVFRISFPGSRRGDKIIENSRDVEKQDDNSLFITSVDNEKYNCLLPLSLTTEPMSTTEEYYGLSPFQLLKPLFIQLTCSYRQEQFWIYELCHGRWLRQYHEENTLEGSHTQEYILGMYDITKFEIDDLEHTKTMQSNQDFRKYKIHLALEEGASEIYITNLPTIKVEGEEISYLEINMVDGTQCELNGKPRNSQVFYGCGDKIHEIYSIKETFSCEYEIIVLSSLLCTHPKYRIKHIQENYIHCYSLDGSPRKPRTLVALENEEKEILEEKYEKLPIVPKPIPKVLPTTTPHDPKIIQDFLNGEYCLHGGSSWWKYEFCYGKKVEQYHEEKDKTRITILLGTWKYQHHMNWLAQNSLKRPKPGIVPRLVSHFYSGGTICDVTGKPRQVEVKLKCKEVKGHPDMVSLYLTEPAICEYVLKVESPIICPLLTTVDENGLFHPES